MNKLKARAWFGFIFLGLAMGFLLFISAGAIYYWQAWIYLAAFLFSTGLITRWLMKNDPALLERRVKAGPVAEKEVAQKIIQSFASIAFLAIFIVSALDHRFRWSVLPLVAVIAGDVLVIAGLRIVFLVFKENTFTAATIEVAEGQKIISTGPYAVVRHPMYAGAFVMLLGTPVALGSWWGLLAVPPLIAVIIIRLLKEEQFLAGHLLGYTEYCAKVRWRLVPRIF